jgi:predicted AAA+ superfamily ATPase
MSISQEVLIKITNSMRMFRTLLGVKFVNREFEARKVIDESKKTIFIFSGMINVLYGPKGCGKTTFFKAF